MVFLVNFIHHVYQYPARRWCLRCSAICQSYMVPVLKQILMENKIGVALEEGGNPYRGRIDKARERQCFKRTLLEKAIEAIGRGNIPHDFVDITVEQAKVLVRKGKISDVSELEKSPQLRDYYIAQNASEIFSKNRGKNGLLLVADKHFVGVKEFFEKRGVPIQLDTIGRYDWYRPIDENLMHSNGDHTFTN